MGIQSDVMRLRASSDTRVLTSALCRVRSFQMLFLRGWLIGEFVWTIVDPMSLYMHRFYTAVTGRKADKAE
jgi:hypothetical protein